MPLEQHIEENAIRTPRFPDVTIHLANFPPISAHAIFLSRSPYLNTLLSNQPPSPPYTINLPTSSDPHPTYDSLLNTIHSLYTSSPLPPVAPDSSTIISYIASSCILGVYPTPLVDSYRSILLKTNLTPTNILPFISFLLSTPHPLDPPTAHPGPYPPFTTGLLSNVITYFISVLPLQLQSTCSPLAALPPSANTEDYKTLLLPLPFEILKLVLEHPGLAVASEKQRYELAKSVVAKRAAREKHARQKPDGTGVCAAPVEESVVLKVGGGKGSTSGVQLIRSFARRQRLWRAQPNGHHTRNGTNGGK
jgi:hypothetical protein